MVCVPIGAHGVSHPWSATFLYQDKNEIASAEMHGIDKNKTHGGQISK